MLKSILLSMGCLLSITSVIPVSQPEKLTIYNSSNSELVKLVDKMNSESDWGNVKQNGKVQVADSEIDLEVTFTDRSKSLQMFKKQFAEQLKLIQNDLNMSELSISNYYEYFTYIKENEMKFSGEEYWKMLGFFDIFENNEENNQIMNLIKKYNKTKSVNYLHTIDSMLPDYSMKTVKQSNVFATYSLTKMPNTKEAINYAKKYAVHANPAYNYFAYNPTTKEGGDCANFASQIARAGGMPNTTYWKPYTYSWNTAHGFSSSGFGKKNKSTKWNTFVKYLKPGTFIAVDYQGDGKCDHIAFITGNGSTSTTKYIAQHTSNYHKLSSSTNWPKDSANRVLYTVGNP